MPDMAGAKSNQHDDRQQQKRQEDLQNLYAMLPEVEPETIEIHYEQFEQDAQKTYNYFNRKANPFGGIESAMVITPSTVDNDVAVIDLLMGEGMANQPGVRQASGVISPEQIQLMASNLPAEEKLMINQAMEQDKKERQKKKVEKAKKKGFCGCFA